MVYVALLRGINVGGNNKIVMRELAAAFEAAGMTDVRTYINSGNVIFTNDTHPQHRLAPLLEQTIARAYGFHVDVLVKSIEQMRDIVAVLPETWRNDSTMKCDVVFLWDALDPHTVLSDLAPRQGIDDVRTAPGAVIWKVDRPNATKSGLLKMLGMSLYRQVTLRNCNTLRKIVALMEQAEYSE